MGFDKMRSHVRRARYICADPACRAVDHDKVFEGDIPHPQINCWKCGGGQKGKQGGVAFQSWEPDAEVEGQAAS